MPATSRASPTRLPAPDHAAGRGAHDRGRSGDNANGDGGMVTVEAAIALCAFVTVLAMVLSGISLVLNQIRCTDAAREAARLVARGDGARADSVVAAVAPGATLSVTTQGDGITVAVRGAAAALLPGIHVSADAFAVREPDADDSEPTGPPANAGPATDSASDRLPRQAGDDGR
jgi:hypothetical protein